MLIDFQNKFEYPDQDILYQVFGLIDTAMKDNADIILCEFFGFGSTWKAIRKKLKGYDQLYLIRKKSQDGGRHVIRSLKRKKINQPNRIVVAGLYAEWCVKSTITTMAEYMKETEFIIHKKACIPKYPEKAWEDYNCYLGYLKNLKLL